MLTPEDKARLGALADLGQRAGAVDLQVGYDCPHDLAPAGHVCQQTTWWCSMRWNGARLMADGFESPGDAADQLAARILNGGVCKCGRTAVVGQGPRNDGECEWRRIEARWEPSCDDEPMSAKRGDVASMGRAARRRQARNRSRR